MIGHPYEDEAAGLMSEALETARQLINARQSIRLLRETLIRYDRIAQNIYLASKLIKADWEELREAHVQAEAALKAEPVLAHPPPRTPTEGIERVIEWIKNPNSRSLP